MNNEDERDNYDNDIREAVYYGDSEEISRKGKMITRSSNEDEEEDIILMGEVEDMK